MSQLDFVFFGTSHFAEIILEELKHKGFTPSLIVTGEDKPQGRGLVLTPPPVKVWAEKNNIQVLQPKTLKDPQLISQLKARSSQPFILASYGRIVPSEVLSIPEKGIINVHPSLLPKLRGPSPIQSAILNEDKTGVSIMLLDEEVDHGPVLAQKEVFKEALDWPPYFSDLEKILGELGAELLAEVVPQWIEGKIEAKVQDHSLATFTKKITKEDAYISLDFPAQLNLRKIRAYSDSPTAYTEIQTKKGLLRVKIKKARIENGVLVLERLVPEGSKEMSWEDFSRGFIQ